jgi:hypothetical protein
LEKGPRITRSGIGVVGDSGGNDDAGHRPSQQISLSLAKLQSGVQTAGR